MKKEIEIKANEIIGMGVIDGKFTFCLADKEFEWLILDDEVIKMIKEFYKLHG